MVIDRQNRQNLAVIVVFFSYSDIAKQAGAFFKEGVGKIAWFGDSCNVVNLEKLRGRK